MDLVDAFKKLGFTQQEAIIYMELCRQGSLTGYEAAKHSGISRSNVYAALSGLVEKGGAYVIEGSPTKYIAVSKEELFLNTTRSLSNTLQYIDTNFPQQISADEPYITVIGYKNILDKIQTMIQLADKRIYISTTCEVLTLLTNDLTRAVEKGLKVVIITPQAHGIDGTTTYLQPKENGQIRMIVDTQEVLTGRLDHIDPIQCLYSKNKTLVDLMRETFINEIELIKIKQHQ